MKELGNWNRSMGVSFKSRLGRLHSEARQSGFKIPPSTARKGQRFWPWRLICLATDKIYRMWGVERVVEFFWGGIWKRPPWADSSLNRICLNNYGVLSMFVDCCPLPVVTVLSKQDIAGRLTMTCIRSNYLKIQTQQATDNLQRTFPNRSKSWYLE